MNKIFIVFCLIISSLTVSAQQFSLYNTGTVYDSFENPSQRSFIPDSSRQAAFNFFVPNFNANLYITGNSQGSLKNRAFQTPASYDAAALRINRGATNHFNGNANAYSIMLKLYTSLNGDVEIGFSAQTKVETRGLYSDETVALLDGPSNFPRDDYDNIFNDHYQYQAYNQLGFSYRERINKQFAFGFKLSALLGIQYQSLNITQSHITFNRADTSANLALKGSYYDSYIPGKVTARDYLPTTRNPGASISIGTSYRTDDGVILQGNIKDLGFIHWSGRSKVYNFDSETTISGLESGSREDSIYNHTQKIFRSSGAVGSFTTKTDAKAELSATKTYWLDEDKTVRYFPTLIAQKELFYTGFTGALVNTVQHNNLYGTLTFTYDDLKLFNAGAQFMVKSANAEFYIGSERLINSGRFLLAATGNTTQIDHVGSFTGADIYLGFTLKFGQVIEHPMNASTIPMGEKGFFGRLFGRIFKTND